MRKGDKIKVIAGKYAGKRGVFVGVASPLSYRVVLEDGERRTLRRTSIEREQDTPPPPNFDDILLQIQQLQQALNQLELTVKSMANRH